MSGACREKIVRRGAGEWLLAAEALLLLTCFRVALAVVPVRWILRRITRERALANGAVDGSSSVRDAAIAVRVRWAVEAVVRHSPVRFVCFPQTLAGYAMLHRRGVQSTMVYGVARTAAGKLIAHTWLMLGDKCLLGGEGAGEFTPVERWG
jgi:hypothetical protein